MQETLANIAMAQLKMQMGLVERQNIVRNESGNIPQTPVNVPVQHVPMPQQQPAGRHPHGVGSDVLPALHQIPISSSPIRFNGSTLHHGERRGCAIELSHGTTVDVTQLRGFGSSHALPGTLPDFKAPILKKR